ncbi:LysR family transcriptional regulator [Dethiobacter alkaliphilus]|uniref:Transcriptional regulator, LysR family n=1 Tax=Dethiobacter alkaliphilus AHT 1 TaxID=555088 RepID=C0GFV9_DETAL|nr:LysR family transcriptional regulator [Dethiobacter alkaliphilus]EEG77648.1 transcriptional regulator, LysR family [Dethiobacter alkaliphilus AHT 1]
MDFSSLRALCVVIDCGSISKAARKLFVSQPSLSVKIRDLESHFQTTLLERTNKGIRPTEAGLMVYQHAQKMLSLEESIERKLDKTKSQEQQLTVGTSTTLGDYALPCTVYNFQEKYPHYKILLEITDSEQVINMVLDQRVELGLIEGPISAEMREKLRQEGIKTRRVATSELIVVVPYNEYWQNIDSISMEKEFTSLPLVIRKKGSGIRTTLEMALHKYGLSLDHLNVVLELNTTNAMVAAVEANKGVTLLPEMAIRKELHYKTLKKITIENVTLRHHFTTLYYPGKSEKEVHSIFLNFLHSRERGFC